MTYNGRAMAERPAAVLDYGAFQQPPSPLFRDYLAAAASVAPFYDGGLWRGMSSRIVLIASVRLISGSKAL